MKQESILKKVFWPEDKENLIGNLIYTYVAEDFSFTTEVLVSRKDNLLEILYSTSPVMEPDNKTFLTKLYLDKDEKNITINKDKTSPQIKTEEDMINLLNDIQGAILKMNNKGQFFPTGVVNNLTNKLSI